jgi:hypothetical protein
MSDILNLSWAWEYVKTRTSTTLTTDRFKIRINRIEEGVMITVREKET